jgi:hypothetical protein
MAWACLALLSAKPFGSICGKPTRQMMKTPLAKPKKNRSPSADSVKELDFQTYKQWYVQLTVFNMHGACVEVISCLGSGFAEMLRWETARDKER